MKWCMKDSLGIAHPCGAESLESESETKHIAQEITDRSCDKEQKKAYRVP